MAQTTNNNEKSAATIAYALFQDIAFAERKNMRGGITAFNTTPDRAYILDTYAECMKVVMGERPVTSTGSQVDVSGLSEEQLRELASIRRGDD